MNHGLVGGAIGSIRQLSLDVVQAGGFAAFGDAFDLDSSPGRSMTPSMMRRAEEELSMRRVGTPVNRHLRLRLRLGSGFFDVVDRPYPGPLHRSSSSLRPQRQYWIDPRRATRRDKTRGRDHQDRECRDSQIGEGVVRGYSEQHPGEKSGRDQRHANSGLPPPSIVPCHPVRRRSELVGCALTIGTGEEPAGGTCHSATIRSDSAYGNGFHNTP